MKVSTIYDEYMIPNNLQEHMLRVAALADILLNHWIGIKVDSEAIVTTCLFHDIAKPMNFNLAKQAEFGMKQSDILKLKKLQEYLKSEFGENEHRATVKIFEKMGMSLKAVQLVDNLEWSNIPELLKNNDIESLIPIYCDMRIGPYGILSMNDRLSDLKKRTNSSDYTENTTNGLQVEKIMIKNIDIELNSIDDRQILKRFKTLLDRSPDEGTPGICR